MKKIDNSTGPFQYRSIIFTGHYVTDVCCGLRHVPALTFIDGFGRFLLIEEGYFRFLIYMGYNAPRVLSIL